MFKLFGLLISMFFALNSFAAVEFPLGSDSSSWGVPIEVGGENLRFRVGARLQGLLMESAKENQQAQDLNNQFEFYIRRSRFQFQANYLEDYLLYVDLRSDNIGQGVEGEQGFQVGDASFRVLEIFGVRGLQFRAFRTKVDVSYSQTASSANLLFLNRASVSDAAADYISSGRRASNVQVEGHWNHFMFQLATGESVEKTSFVDAKGASLTSGDLLVTSPMIGGKVRISPFHGFALPKVTETFFGQGKHLTFGVGYFYAGGIHFQGPAQSEFATTERSLLNLEASFHYYNLSVLAESFYFNGVVKDFSEVQVSKGSSQGHYVQAEYVFTDFYFLAPFIRYELWNRFQQLNGFNLESEIIGLNWYARGNKFRMGLALQNTLWGRELAPSDEKGHAFVKNQQVMLSTMLHF